MKKKNAKKKKYKAPRLEEIIVEDTKETIASACSHWRGVWGGCGCHCEQAPGISVN